MMLFETRLGPSSIHGIGVFADEDIPAGAVVCDEILHVRLSDEHVRLLPQLAMNFVRRYAYLHGGSWWLCLDHARFLNHSMTPNLRSRFDSGEDVAIKFIAKGEELTVDYYSFDERAEEKLA